MRPILFIDRDGVILQEPKTDFQIDTLEKTSFVVGAITHLQKIAAGKENSISTGYSSPIGR